MAVPNTVDYQSVGSVIYPGIKQIVNASYSRSHGITPDVCTIEMAPQTLDATDPNYTAIEPEGYLIFRFDTAKTVTDGNGISSTTNKRVEILMQGCRPDKASVRKSATSENWTIPIFDRRWKWKFGSFSGHWNIKKNGVIEKRKEKTPRELADMCLDAMGETKYETKALDQLEKLKSLPYRKQVRPEVHWDRIPPAQALNELATSLGYRVCLGWDEVVRIERFGEGALLPTADLMSGGFEAELPETPDSISVLGGISYFEASWELEAVGLDIDGEWKPIDHLSYCPSRDTGWVFSGPPDYPGIVQKYDEVNSNKKLKDAVMEHRKQQFKLAKESVYRCYRLKYPVNTKEDKQLRGTYNILGKDLAARIDKGERRGDSRAFDLLTEKYEAVGRELFFKAKPILPGPKVINPKTGKESDLEVQELDQVLPCYETRAGLAIDPLTGKLTRKPPIVLGEFWSELRGYNTPPNVYIDKNKYEVLPNQGIIKFTEPIFRMRTVQVAGKNGKKYPKILHGPALLNVLIATPLKSLAGELARYQYLYKVPQKYRTKPVKLPSGLKGNPRKLSGGTGTKIVVNNQIVQYYQAVYEIKKNQTTGKYETKIIEIRDNSKTEDFEKQALATIDVETLKLRAKDSGSGVYAGLKKINLDGAIQQVVISRNTSGGMTTTIARHTEVNIYVPDFDERQRNLALKKMIKAQNESVDKTEKVQPKDQ